MNIKVPKTNETAVVIKEYENFYLVERKAGYRECISKHDLGLIKEMIKPNRKLDKIPRK